MSALPEAIEARLRELPAGLRDHIERARSVSQELAFRHGVDPALADLGTAAHDMARAVPPESLLSEAERLGLHIDFVHRHQPLLLHGPVAAAWLEQEDEYFVPDVIESADGPHHGSDGYERSSQGGIPRRQAGPQEGQTLPILGSGLKRGATRFSTREFLNISAIPFATSPRRVTSSRLRLWS